MSEELPQFKYHPKPIETGAIEVSDTICICCQRSRGYIYIGPVYSYLKIDNRFCPWCIADGTASERFGADFSAGDTFVPLSEEISKEVQCRNPGYISWQQDKWRIHCNDACEFHGDVSKKEMQELNPEAKEWLMSELQLEEIEWLEFTKHYEPAGDPAVYKFVCRHCGIILYDWDCS